MKALNPFYDEDVERRDNVRAALRGDTGHSRFIGDYVKVADSTLGFIKVQGIALGVLVEGHRQLCAQPTPDLTADRERIDVV